jgi:uncharacterized protein (DUF1499 family)
VTHPGPAGATATATGGAGAGRRSRLALVAAVFAGLAVLDLALGLLLVGIGVATPFVAFVLFAVGLLEGLIGLVLGLLALFATRGSSGLGGRGLALAAVACGAVITAVGVMASAPGRGLPRINDITTDPNDPPEFVLSPDLPDAPDRDWSYPPEFAAIQRDAYRDIAPIRMLRPPPEAYARVRDAAVALGWEIVAERPEEGRLEARQTSRWFRFVDDIAVRVRPAEDGSANASRIDVRSKSRDGQGDLGVNAARIRALRDYLTTPGGPPAASPDAG